MMTAYENMYRALFSGISNAILNIEENNFGLAKDTLIKAKKCYRRARMTRNGRTKLRTYSR